jgi:L-alanine-DL-glutamate epimerase-like enolase superfamily enzyme
MKRRRFLQTTSIAAGCMWASFPKKLHAQSVGSDQLRRIDEAPVLRPDYLREPIIIESVELLRNKSNFLVRIRSKDGAESVTAPNSLRLKDCYPIFNSRVGRFFVGKNACKIESLLNELYRFSSNYKWQGLAFWVCQAALEMGVLDLIGKVRGVPLGELFGKIRQRDIAIYRASGNRRNTPQQEANVLGRFIAQTGAKAVKIRIGGRMKSIEDKISGRTEKLIPYIRKALGGKVTLYADSNSSYEVKDAIRIGRLLEENNYAFYEEPVPFDHLWETKEVTKALKIPVAGGEQEYSMRRFRWAIANRAMDIVQPDLHYNGGFIRGVRVAKMAEAAGLKCAPHMSGSGLGYVNVLHFASFISNITAHQEFKGESDIPCQSKSSSLKAENGIVVCPKDPGMGVEIDPDYIKKAEPVNS